MAVTVQLAKEESSLATQAAGWLTPALAIFAGYIAWRQARTAKFAAILAGNKLKFDLYKERKEIYEAMLVVLDACYNNGDPVSLAEARKVLQRAPWLFDQKMVDQLQKMEEVALMLLPADPQADRLYSPLKAQARALDLARNRLMLADWFKEYMHIDSPRIP